MPADERRTFDHLRNCAGKPLEELTATSSGGFAGYQTSADPILVFDEVEDSGEILKLRPRHEPKRCGCTDAPIEIEKEALRPFVFGRDVGRWLVDWKKTWVMFPYDKYPKKQSLYDEEATIEGWNLVPSGDNLGEFTFADPDSILVIEERFPKAWRYLQNHESVLRARERHRYAKDKSEGGTWYGATYPRGLDFYFRPKLMVQLLSRFNSVAYDPAGKFVFQAGGKGGGVYGIVPGGKVNSRALQAFLSSKVADFLIKQVSSVYGGRYYSYADQFLRDLPICQSLVEGKSRPAKDSGDLAEEISELCGTRQSLFRKLSEFPDSFASELSKYELDSVKNLCNGQPQAENLKIGRDAIRVEAALYGFEVHYGDQSPFEFESAAHAECLAEAFRSQTRQGIRRKAVLSWRLPVTEGGCKKLLDLLANVRIELGQLINGISSQEASLNDLIYEMYGVRREERRVVEDFLARYSGGSAEAENDQIDADGE
jgi:hypothetical protein